MSSNGNTQYIIPGKSTCSLNKASVYFHSRLTSLTFGVSTESWANKIAEFPFECHELPVIITFTIYRNSYVRHLFFIMRNRFSSWYGKLRKVELLVYDWTLLIIYVDCHVLRTTRIIDRYEIAGQTWNRLAFDQGRWHDKRGANLWVSGTQKIMDDDDD